MLKNFLVHVKYPSAAGILISMWAGSYTLLILFPENMRISTVLPINIAASFIISMVGFRTEKD